MAEKFVEMLAVGGKSNSLGRVNEVIELVINNKDRLAELFGCVFDDDAWIRMRAVDAIEKICRIHPEWITPYIDKFSQELAPKSQPSIQWHLAQIYSQVSLTSEQKNFVINWLKNLLSTKDVDWIVSANAMVTLVQFTNDDSFPRDEMAALLKIQQKHKSKAVVKRANKLLDEITAD
jgi:hypothetical protein